MKDGAIAEDRTLSLEHQAITYILDRIQHDENLRWHMLHTQAHALLCQAEASRLGVDPEEHTEARRKWKGQTCKDGMPPTPRVVEYERLLEEHGIDF